MVNFEVKGLYHVKFAVSNSWVNFININLNSPNIGAGGGNIIKFWDSTTSTNVSAALPLPNYWNEYM